MPNNKDYKEEFSTLISACIEAGAIAMDYYRGEYNTEFKPEAGNSPVTEADKAVDYYLRQTLTKAYPDYAWLSEETEDDLARLGNSHVWIVDPIDGTRSFMKQDDMFAVSAALVVDNQPVLAVIYNPAKDELITAMHGGGVSLNKKLLPKLTPKPFGQNICLASVSEMKAGLWDGLKEKLTVVPISSIAYKLAILSIGRMDMMVSLRPKSEWDIAAGQLLVEEAGMEMTDLSGNPVLYNQPDVRRNGVIVAFPQHFKRLQELL